MSRGIVDTIVGGLEIAGAIVAATVTFGAAAPLIGWAVAGLIIAAGAGTLLTGIGTMISDASQGGGIVTASRNPVGPWNVIYGRARVGGTMTVLKGNR